MIGVEFKAALYTALWYETGGRFNPKDDACVRGTDPKKCGTSGGANDRGGFTKYGIASKFHPTVDVKNLNLEQATSIYFDKYWKAAYCDRMPPQIGAYCFDTACNSGTSRAIKLLQSALGVAPDGVIGDKTVDALTSVDSDKLLAKYVKLRCDFLVGIAVGNQAEFLPGWINRATGAPEKWKFFCRM